MRILMVNKFLYPRGGAETYFLKLGERLAETGHEVEYFGMYDTRNIVGNSIGEYTENKDFRSGLSARKLLYPFEIVYSFSARKKIGRVIDFFKPDVVHLNNISFHITPSIIYEIKRRGIPIVWTAHDYQAVCPCHMLYVAHRNRLCEECTHRSCLPCVKNRCVHGSAVKSIVAMLEGELYRRLDAYSMVDKVICPSRFIMEKLENTRAFSGKCEVMHNFSASPSSNDVEKGDYVLYFGRYDLEKGVRTLLAACRELPHVNFVFAGSGSLENELDGIPNVKNVGFKTGDELEALVRASLFTVCPSEWYENCPFSVIEAQACGVPVIGADIGGIPELIDDGRTGVLFKSGSKDGLKNAIDRLWKNRALSDEMSRRCLEIHRNDLNSYCDGLLFLYGQIVGCNHYESR